MGGFDIIVGIVFVYAAFRGFRDGILVQLGGIVGLYAGVWLAFRYAGRAAGLLHLGEPTATIVGFIVILLGVLLVVSLVGHLARGVFKIAGLGPFDAVGGLILGIAKMALILGVLLKVFDALNADAKWIDPDRYVHAALYEPLRETVDRLFPYLELAKDKITENND